MLISSSLKFFQEDESYLNKAQSLKDHLSEMKIELDEIKDKSSEKPEIESKLDEIEEKLNVIIVRERDKSSFDVREDILEPLFIIFLIDLIPRINNKQNKSA